MPASMAPRNVILIDGTSNSATYTITPLITSMNSPNVNKIAGSDKITMIGRKMTLTIENTSPASKNVATPADVDAKSPVESNRIAIHMANELASHLSKNNPNCDFIYVYYSRFTQPQRDECTGKYAPLFSHPLPRSAAALWRLLPQCRCQIPQRVFCVSLHPHPEYRQGYFWSRLFV